MKSVQLKFTAKKSDNQSVPVLPAEIIKIVSGLALVIIKAQKVNEVCKHFLTSLNINLLCSVCRNVVR